LFQAASSTAFSVIPIATAHISLAGNFIDAVANPLRLFRLREDAVESGFQGSRDGPCFGASALDSRHLGSCLRSCRIGQALDKIRPKRVALSELCHCAKDAHENHRQAKNSAPLFQNVYDSLDRKSTSMISSH